MGQQTNGQTSRIKTSIEAMFKRNLINLNNKKSGLKKKLLHLKLLPAILSSNPKSCKGNKYKSGIQFET